MGGCTCGGVCGWFIGRAGSSRPDGEVSDGHRRAATIFFLPINNQQSTIVNHSSVIFTGPAFGDAKDALLRQASAFILPSFSEGLPMSVLEAWSYRLPVLMTDFCNIPEGFAADAAIRIGTGVRGQEAGVSGQPMGIDEGMRALVEMTDAERMVMGQRGRALVEQQFTWPRRWRRR